MASEVPAETVLSGRTRCRAQVCGQSPSCRTAAPQSPAAAGGPHSCTRGGLASRCGHFHLGGGVSSWVFLTMSVVKVDGVGFLRLFLRSFNLPLLSHFCVFRCIIPFR